MENYFPDQLKKLTFESWCFAYGQNEKGIVKSTSCPRNYNFR